MLATTLMINEKFGVWGGIVFLIGGIALWYLGYKWIERHEKIADRKK